MEITLRRADALQRDIRTALKRIPLKPVISVSEFENGEEAIKDASTSLFTNCVTWSGLVEALYEIRRHVGRANVAAGISDDLAHLAEIDDRLSMLKGLTQPEARRLDPKVLEGRLEKMRQSSDPQATRFGYAVDEVSTGILSERGLAEFEAEINDLRRRQRDLRDGLLEKNVSNRITLSEGSVKLLKEAGLI